MIETLAGVAPFQKPQTALTANFGSVTGIATDTKGNTFVVAGNFRSVLKIDSAGNVTVYAGQPLASGPLQATGDGGSATAATLVSPTGLAVDSTGNLYIADEGSFTVRMVAASTGIITTVAGTLNKSGSSPDGTLAVDALLADPSSVAVDAVGNMFLVDGGSLKRVDHTTGVISQYGGTSGSCQVLSNTQTCPIDSVGLEANFWPSSIVISNGTLYVSAIYVYTGAGLYTSSILSIELNTGTTRLLAGGGEAAPSVPGNTAIGANLDPLGLAVDSAGNVDFTEGSGPQVYGASSIMQLPVNGTSLTTISGTGQIGSTGDGGPATAAEILSALSITVASSGDVLFTEPARIRSIDTAGMIATFAGTGAYNYSGDGGPAQMAGISTSPDTVADAKGNLYIADSGNGVIRRIDGLTGIITTIAGNGGFASYGQESTPNSLPGDGGPATQTPLGTPNTLAFGAGSNLYIGDYYQGIRVVDISTGTITTLNSQLNVAGTMAFDGQHTLYATNGVYVDAVDTKSGTSTVVAGNGSNSFTYPGDSFGDGGPAIDAYIFPNGLALDNAGNLYIADALENGIRIVNLSTGVINVYAGGYPDGIFTGMNYGYTGDGGPASAATFQTIAGLHTDGMGNLLLADIGNNAIREINLSSKIINTVAGDGSAGYSGDGASATAAMLNLPYSASADALGNLYIGADSRIRRVVVNPVALTAVLSTPSTSVVTGENVDLTATYGGTSFGIPPTGVVTFYNGTSALGTGTLSPSQVTSGEFVATLTTSELAVGNASITAQLSPDANYAGVTSAPVTMVVTPAAPAVTLSATSLEFASTIVGTSGAPQVLTLTNSGTGALTITSIAASGDFAETNTCGSSLAAGANCTISVTFTPTMSGSLTGEIIIADNASTSPQNVTLSGTGTPAPAPIATLSPTSLTYASQAVGTSSTAQTVTLANSGNATLTGIAVAIAGANAGDFAQTSTCSATLSASQSCVISIVFTPGAAGSASATLTVTDNGGTSPQTVTLSGTAPDAPFAIAPQTGGSTSSTVTAGQPASYALSMTPADGYSGTVSLTCSSLPTNASCSFTPSSLPLSGGKSATFAVTIATQATQTAAAVLGKVSVGSLLAGFLILLPWRRKRNRFLLLAAVPLLLLGAAAGISGCGSGSSTPPPPQSQNVAAGTYTVQIVASDNTITVKQPLTLVVQ